MPACLVFLLRPKCIHDRAHDIFRSREIFNARYSSHGHCSGKLPHRIVLGMDVHVECRASAKQKLRSEHRCDEKQEGVLPQDLSINHTTNTIKHNPGSLWCARYLPSTHLSPPAIHRSSHPPPSRHIAEHRSSIAHNVRYIAIATWEEAHSSTFCCLAFSAASTNSSAPSAGGTTSSLHSAALSDHWQLSNPSGWLRHLSLSRALNIGGAGK